MEVTKWLKPSVKRVTKYGDSASVQPCSKLFSTTLVCWRVIAKVPRRKIEIIFWFTARMGVRLRKLCCAYRATFLLYR